MTFNFLNIIESYNTLMDKNMMRRTNNELVSLIVAPLAEQLLATLDDQASDPIILNLYRAFINC